MAPPQNHPNQVRLSSPFSTSTEHRRCRGSKAQMCFFRILHIISVFPADEVTDNNCLNNDDGICENKAFVVDLNIGLRPPTEAEPCDTPTTAYEGAVAENSNCVFEKDDRRKSESELAVEEERATEHSEISHVGDQSSGIDYNGVSELVVEVEDKPRDEGHLRLLIEAAQLILGDDSEQDKKPPSHKTEPRRSKHVEASATLTAIGGTKRKPQCWTAAAEAEWYAEFEDTSPVVKSKRGRNQVLPYKYRDSVVEPLVRWASPTSNHRSISSAAAVPTKRRSK